ncbi:MAG: hypothetical protein R3A43_04975 [Bacteroidia bacterium]
MKMQLNNRSSIKLLLVVLNTVCCKSVYHEKPKEGELIVNFTINKLFKIGDSTEIVRLKQDSIEFSDRNTYSPDIYFVNKKKDQYLRVIIFYGGIRNTPDWFEIGRYNNLRDSCFSDRIIETNFDSFLVNDDFWIGKAMDIPEIMFGNWSEIFEQEDYLTLFNNQNLQIAERSFFYDIFTITLSKKFNTIEKISFGSNYYRPINACEIIKLGKWQSIYEQQLQQSGN